MGYVEMGLLGQIIGISIVSLRKTGTAYLQSRGMWFTLIDAHVILLARVVARRRGSRFLHDALCRTA